MAITMSTVYEDKASSFGSVDLYAIDERPGRTHWVERLYVDGRVSSVTVKHPDGTKCSLDKASRPGDWLACAVPGNGKACRFVR